jgi:hypothetical protein
LDEIHLDLIITEDKRSEAFADFCEKLSRLVPQVQIVKKKADTGQVPAIQIGDNIRYQAIPGGKELEPFLEAITLGDKQNDPANEIKDALEKIYTPAELELFIAQNCSLCPQVVRRMIPLVMANELIRLSIIDASLFSERARSELIRSVPTVLLDGQYRWTGTIKLQDIIEMLVNRNPVHLGTAALRTIIEEGNAARVAEWMLEQGLIFPAFLELLVHEKWPVRLGAIVVLETIIEQNIDLAAQVVDPLLEHLPVTTDPVKGDIVYILGETADQNIIPKLEGVSIDSDNPELKEMAREAIVKIKNRQPDTKAV